MSRTSEAIKQKIRSLLNSADYDTVVTLSDKHSSILRILISMTYDKQETISWRAMDAAGRVTSHLSDEKARHVIQRLLWMMREESGSNPWSSAEIIGEIIKNNPDPFVDIVPVLMSFHEEDFLRPGVLFAISRIAEVRPDLVSPFSNLLLESLVSNNPEERGCALLALGHMGQKELIPEIERLVNDKESFTYYNGESLIESTITTVATETIKKIQPV